MPKNAPRIVVAGDVLIDRPHFEAPPLTAGDRPRMLTASLPAGAALLRRLAHAAIGVGNGPEAVESPAGEAPNRYFGLREATARSGARVLVPAGAFAFAGLPARGSPPAWQDDPDAEIVVLYDAGLGFGDRPDSWPAALAARPLVVAVLRPGATGAMLDRLVAQHADRLVVVIDADTVRAAGAAISRGLSWERTATELVWQLAYAPALRGLSGAAHLCVRFANDGVAHRCPDSGGETCLHFDPIADGSGDADETAAMPGTASAFAAALVGALSAGGLDALDEAVPRALRVSRRFAAAGFGTLASAAASSGAVLACAGAEIFATPRSAEAAIEAVPVPTPVPQGTDPGHWRILDHIRSGDLEQLAFDIVERGPAAALGNVPRGRFGALETVDRVEIEGLRTIRKLIANYLSLAAPPRPLSIAVFGPPGSGKSFGVKQIVRSLGSPAAGARRIAVLEYNVAQLDAPGQLARAFDAVRDAALTGQLPLVFFDEFDSDLDGRKLGWLKYLLAPMQDGCYLDEGVMRPLGRAIFVFAGGTRDTFAAFSRRDADADAFREAKGPDFVSRLRGHVDVLGIDPGEGKPLFLVQRAMVTRALVQRLYPALIETGGRARIASGVLRALIKVPRYHHGVRSLEAVLDMSALAGADDFTPAALPPPTQLAAHVDAGAFARLVERDTMLGAARERLAQAVHERYRRERVSASAEADAALSEWDVLDESLKESNRSQADDVPAKLQAIGFGYEVGDGDSGEPVRFTADEIETLARLEHTRFVEERRAQGWTLAAERDADRKTSPYLVPWEQLDERARELDRAAVAEIPALMRAAGLRVYRRQHAALLISGGSTSAEPHVTGSKGLRR